MSADNGIYIAKFPDGWRVIHTQAIDNLDYFPKGSAEYRREWREYFGGAPVFPTLEAAYAKASEMEEEILSDDFCPVLEYGVVVLPGEHEALE